jgi:pimeloyl-[acyl-carrier protein] synthase
VAHEPDGVAAAEHLFGPDMRADPYPVYHRLRATDPMHWDEHLQVWIVTRYRDVASALHDPRLSADRVTYIREVIGREELLPFFDFLGNRMVFCDPPKHTRLRGLLNKAFTPHAVEAMRPRVQVLVDGFIDKALPQGGMDVIRDFAFPLPATVISLMLGVPPADIGPLKSWSDEFVVFFGNAPSAITADQYRRCAEAAEAMTRYFRSAVERVKQHPEGTLLGAMELVEEAGDRLSEAELFASANLLMVAGHETTTNLIGNGLLTLLQHPDQLRRLRDEPALLPRAVEELLRHGNPVQFTNRVARADLDLGGKRIAKGQMLLLMLAAANRDPEQFPDPDRVDLARTPNHHFALGQGIHACLGAPLARLEAQVAFGTLLRRLPGLKLTGGNLEYRENFNFHGLKALPVNF